MVEFIILASDDWYPAEREQEKAFAKMFRRRAAISRRHWIP
jgi:hypothetical protein